MKNFTFISYTLVSIKSNGLFIINKVAVSLWSKSLMTAKKNWNRYFFVFSDSALYHCFWTFIQFQ